VLPRAGLLAVEPGVRPELGAGRGHADDNVAELTVSGVPYLEHQGTLDAWVAAAPQRRPHAAHGLGGKRGRR
jgi:hypothetical protein